MTSPGSRFSESPEAASRPLPYRRAYQAHPFLLAALPMVAGVLLWLLATQVRSALLAVAGIGITAFGVFLEVLNLVEWGWRHRRRRRP